ncbi:MAG: hypothetical protein BWY66_01274 [bacterium ADurb.Bin374]|nr:MAG: hypothetical protein BWY66_01274 [bacterium ADurb.Bin374]
MKCITSISIPRPPTKTYDWIVNTGRLVYDPISFPKKNAWSRTTIASGIIRKKFMNVPAGFGLAGGLGTGLMTVLTGFWLTTTTSSMGILPLATRCLVLL